ncbi:hypothetical protein RUND412_001368 [Rhizina undulata]
MKNSFSILVAFFFALFFTAATASPAAAYTPPCATCLVNPTANSCDITTSCIQTQPNGQYHCACRAGYKAAAKDTDSSTHWRTLFAGQEYRVFVKPGTKCDTLCNQWALGPYSCNEVTVRAECS